MIKLNKNRDLTTGSITGGLWSFAVPLMLGNVFQQFYNLADTWVVGKYVGDNAIAAVGSSYTLLTFLNSCRQFLNVKKYTMTERSIATVCTNNQNLCY